MGRDSTIGYNDVAIAANAIHAIGTKVTARSIRSEIGRGSMATILIHFQQWQKDQAIHDLIVDESLMDPMITRAINLLIATKAQEATADISNKLIEEQSSCAELIKEYSLQEQELASKSAALSEIEAQYAVLTGRAEQLESDLKRSALDLNNERKTAELTKMELAVTHHKLEALSRMEAEVDILRSELKVASDKAAESSKVAAVAEAKLEAAMANRKSA